MSNFYYKYGDSLIYSDTDSLILDTPLDSSFIGDNIGQFKLEAHRFC